MKYVIGEYDTGQTWTVEATTEKDALNKVYYKKGVNVPFSYLHCISCTHSSSELKTKKFMAKKYKTKSKKLGKSLTGYMKPNAWTLVFTTKNGDRFRKGFKSETTMNRAMAGWMSKGGKVKWKPNSLTLMRGSRGKRKSK